MKGNIDMEGKQNRMNSSVGPALDASVWTHGFLYLDIEINISCKHVCVYMCYKCML